MTSFLIGHLCEGDAMLYMTQKHFVIDTGSKGVAWRLPYGEVPVLLRGLHPQRQSCPEFRFLIDISGKTFWCIGIKYQMFY